MPLRWNDAMPQRLAMTLYEFLETGGLTDQGLDEACGWIKGTTHELLEKIRPPTHREIIEICLRTRAPLQDFVCTALSDGFGTEPPPRPRRCTQEDPCCGFRLIQRVELETGPNFDCPRNCPCHL
jgi:hypothetical protein